jgi:hypothetical protein
MILSKIQMYATIGVTALLLGIIGSQYLIGKSKDNTIDKLSLKLSSNAALVVIKETENLNLHTIIDRQNVTIAEWKKVGEDFEIRIAEKTQIIFDLQTQSDIVLVDLDTQEIPITCRGSMGWLIEKAQGELR